MLASTFRKINLTDDRNVILMDLKCLSLLKLYHSLDIIQAEGWFSSQIEPYKAKKYLSPQINKALSVLGLRATL